MLTITITPTMLIFENLTDDLAEKVFKELPNEVEVKWNGEQFYIQDKHEMLFKVLLRLTYNYDIEIV